jgi:hypothetical protein
MMMKLLFLALVAAIAVCSQQAQAQLTPQANSNGENTGSNGMKVSTRPLPARVFARSTLVLPSYLCPTLTPTPSPTLFLDCHS